MTARVEVISDAQFHESHKVKTIWLRLRTLPLHISTTAKQEHPHHDNQQLWMGTTDRNDTIKSTRPFSRGSQNNSAYLVRHNSMNFEFWRLYAGALTFLMFGNVWALLLEFLPWSNWTVYSRPRRSTPNLMKLLSTTPILWNYKGNANEACISFIVPYYGGYRHRLYESHVVIASFMVQE